MKNILVVLAIFAIAGCNFKKRDPLQEHPNSKKATPIQDGEVRQKPEPEKIVVEHEVPVEVKVRGEVEPPKEVPVFYPREQEKNFQSDHLVAVDIPNDELRYVLGKTTTQKIVVRNQMNGTANLKLLATKLPSGAKLTEVQSTDARGKTYELSFQPAKGLIEDPSLSEVRIPAKVTLVVSDINLADKTNEAQVKAALKNFGCLEEGNSYSCAHPFDILVNRSGERPALSFEPGFPDVIDLNQDTNPKAFNIKVVAPETQPGKNFEPSVVFEMMLGLSVDMQWGFQFISEAAPKEFVSKDGQEYWIFHYQIDTRNKTIPTQLKLGANGNLIEVHDAKSVLLHIAARAISPIGNATSNPAFAQFEIKYLQQQQPPAAAPAETAAGPAPTNEPAAAAPAATAPQTSPASTPPTAKLKSIKKKPAKKKPAPRRST